MPLSSYCTVLHHVFSSLHSYSALFLCTAYIIRVFFVLHSLHSLGLSDILLGLINFLTCLLSLTLAVHCTQNGFLWICRMHMFSLFIFCSFRLSASLSCNSLTHMFSLGTLGGAPLSCIFWGTSLPLFLSGLSQRTQGTQALPRSLAAHSRLPLLHFVSLTLFLSPLPLLGTQKYCMCLGFSSFSSVHSFSSAVFSASALSPPLCHALHFTCTQDCRISLSAPLALSGWGSSAGFTSGLCTQDADEGAYRTCLPQVHSFVPAVAALKQTPAGLAPLSLFRHFALHTVLFHALQFQARGLRWGCIYLVAKQNTQVLLEQDKPRWVLFPASLARGLIFASEHLFSAAPHNRQKKTGMGLHGASLCRILGTSLVGLCSLHSLLSGTPHGTLLGLCIFSCFAGQAHSLLCTLCISGGSVLWPLTHFLTSLIRPQASFKASK